MNLIELINYRLYSIPEKVFLTFFLSSVFLIYALLGLSGIDMTDEGYLLSSYQQCLTNPGAASFYTCINTLLIGGLWNWGFGCLGIIGHRFLAAICLTINTSIVYFLLRKVTSRLWIIIGTLITILANHYIFVFHYNHTSSLISLLAVLFIFLSITKDNGRYMIWAGIVIGGGILFRLPNICLIGLLMSLALYSIRTSNIRLSLRLFSLAILGIIIGLTINVGLIFLLGYGDYIIPAIRDIFNTATTSGDSHSLSNLFNVIFEQFQGIALYSTVILAFFVLLWVIDNRVTNGYAKGVSEIALFIILFLVISYYTRQQVFVLLYAVCIIPFSYVLLFQNLYSYDIVTLVFLSLLIMVLLPLGSDYYIYNVGAYSIYLAVPLSLSLIWEKIKLSSVLRWAISMCIVLVCAISVRKTMNSCYRDTGARFKKTKVVEESFVRTSLTNPAKAELLNEVIHSIKPYINSDSELLAYPNIPMMNYLTSTKPYLNNSWIGIMTYDSFKKELRRGENNLLKPIIIINKAKDQLWFTPNPSWSSVLDCSDWHPYINEKNELLNDFINRHKYMVKLDNGCFQVLIPRELTI